jgi:hypothetical protein
MSRDRQYMPLKFGNCELEYFNTDNMHVTVVAYQRVYIQLGEESFSIGVASTESQSSPPSIFRSFN